jgi:hypothetical protein
MTDKKLMRFKRKNCLFLIKTQQVSKSDLDVHYNKNSVTCMYYEKDYTFLCQIKQDRCFIK